MVMLAAALKATVDLDLSKAEAGLSRLDADMQRAATAAQRSVSAMDRAFSSAKFTPNVTGIAGMGQAVDSLQSKLTALSSKPHNVQVTSRIQAAQADLSRLNLELQRLKGQPATVQIKADTRAVREQIAEVRREVAQLQTTAGGPGGGGIGGALAGPGLAGGILRLGLATVAVRGLTDAVGAVVGPAANFEQRMSAIQATTGATAPELASLNKLALDLGAAMDVGSVSASDAADAIFELSKAGLSTQSILDGAAKATLQMSAAAGPEFGVANSAALAAAAMNTFARENLSAAQVADTFVGAANASNASLGSLQLGMAAVGSVAATVGLSFHDTAEALALFANKGLQGSDAGTSLKTMLLNLQPVTDRQKELFDQLGITVNGMGNKFFDAQGHIQNLAGIAGVLQTAFAGMTDQQRLATEEMLFGSDAVRAASILYDEGAGGVDRLATAMAKQGDAAGAAATMNANAKGQFEALTGTLQTLAITAGQRATPELGKLAAALNELAASKGAQNAATSAGDALAGLTHNLTAGVGVIGDLGTSLNQLGAIIAVSENKIGVSLGLMSQAAADAANKAVVADAQRAQSADRMNAAIAISFNQAKVALGLMSVAEAEAANKTILANAARAASHSAAAVALAASTSQQRILLNESRTDFDTYHVGIVQTAQITAQDMADAAYTASLGWNENLLGPLSTGLPAVDMYILDLLKRFDIRDAMAFLGDSGAKAFALAVAKGVQNTLLTTAKVLGSLDFFAGGNTGLGRGAAQLQQQALDIAKMVNTTTSTGHLPWEQPVPTTPKTKGPTKPKGSGKSPTQEAQSAIKAATDQTQAISKAITDGIAALNQLSAFTQPAGLQAGLDAFAADTNLVMQRLQQVALNFSTKGLTATSQLADAAGKVYGMLSTGVDYYFKLTEATQKGVTFSGANLAATQQLVTSTVATVTLFGSLIPAWQDTHTAQVAGFADASGKVYGALSAGVDFYAKITDATQKGVQWSGQTQAATEQLARSVVQTVTLFGGLVPAWKDTQTKQVGDFADASGKVLGSLSTAVDLAAKIRDATVAGVSFGRELVTQASQLAISSSAIVQQFGAVVPAWDDLANQKVSAYADTSAKVLSTVGTATDTLSKLRDSKLGLEQIQALVPIAAGVAEATNLIALSFQAGMPAWEDVASTHIGVYADATGKIAGAVGATTDTLAKLRDSQLGLPAIQSLVPTAAAVGEAASLIAQSFKAGMPAWDEFADKTVGDFADSAAKVVSAVGATVDTFTKLQSLDSLVVPWAAMDASMQLLIDTTEHFGNQTRTWDATAVAASAQLADSAGRIVASIGGAFDLLGKLQGLKDLTVPSAALDSVITLLDQSVTRFQAASSAWETKALGVAAQNAESVGKVASALGAGVDTLTKLSSYQAPSTAQIDAYFSGLTLFINQWQTRSKAWEAEGLAAAAGTADSAGKIATGIGAAIDPLVKLGTFQAPSQEGIDAFFAAMGALILGFQAREAAWAAQMTPATVQLAADVQQVTGAISSAIEPLVKMTDLAAKPLDPAQIDNTFALIGLTLQALQNLTGQIGPDQLAAAVGFGGQLAAALGSVKAAVDLLAGLGELSGSPDQLSALLSGVATALAAVPGDLAQGVSDNLAPAVASLHTAGDQLMQGLAGGINDGQHWVTDAATAAVNAAIAAAKSAAGIASPSKRAYAELGLPIPQGQALGILAGIPLLKTAMQRATAATFAAGSLPTPPAGSGVGGRGAGVGTAGSGGGAIIKDSIIVNGQVQATTPTATRDLLVATARRQALKKPGKVGW